MAYRALILDFGGVLTTDLWESIRDCAREEGLPPDALLDLLRKDPEIRELFAGLERGTVSQVDFEAHLGAAAGIAPERLLNRMTASLQPDELMLAEVARLRRHGVATAVLSNSWGSEHFDPYDGYDLEDRMDTVVISDQIGLRKPDPEIFQLILDRLDVKATEAVFVDDLAANLEPARALGMAVIHHTLNTTTVAELQHLFRPSIR
ncbi:HAD family phosphatase [Catellatospora sp. NPDC049111]|uniref:HAD family hydrolase n=1 Tax=Catellatospora sp. NPDC049111 TaxID=3155271 RepID=UPI003410D438